MGLLDHLVIREIGNGAWFILGGEIVLLLALYLSTKVWSQVTGRECRMFMSREPEAHPWWLPEWFTLPMQLGAAIMFLEAGNSLRGGWVWAYMHCVNVGSWCVVVDLAWLLWLAIVVGMIGGACIIRLFSPPEWRLWFVPACMTMAMGIPTLTYLID